MQATKTPFGSEKCPMGFPPVSLYNEGLLSHLQTLSISPLGFFRRLVCNDLNGCENRPSISAV